MTFNHIKIKNKIVFLDARLQHDNNGRPFSLSSVRTDHTKESRYNKALKCYTTPSVVRFFYRDNQKPRAFDARFGYNFEFLSVNFVK